MDASPLQNHEEVPELIRTKCQIFLEQERTIRRLEDELRDLRDQHSQLEKELDPYRYSIYREKQLIRSKKWKTTHLQGYSPIYACPTEILTEIFQYFLACDHYHIRNLLLVCRAWHEIIGGNPALWAHIQVPYIDMSEDASEDEDGDEGEGEDEDKNEDEEVDTVYSNRFDDPLIPYIQACLERSGDLPLNVELQLGWMPSIEVYTSRRALAALRGVVDQRHAERFMADFSSIEGINYRYRHCFLDLFRSSVKRWKSFSITFPDGHGRCDAILRSLCLNKANLESLELFNTGYELKDWDNESGDLLPKLSKIKRLNFGSIPLSYFTGSSSSLLELETVAQYLDDLKVISRCTMLQSLTLEMHHGNYNSFGNISKKNFTHFHFPSLKKFTLIGHFGPLSSFTFDTPMLDVLEICTWGFWYLENKPLGMPELPKVLAREVHWRMRTWIEEDEFSDNLRKLLSQFQEAELIKIFPVLESSLVATLNTHGINKSMVIKLRTSVGNDGQQESKDILESLHKWANHNEYAFGIQSDPNSPLVGLPSTGLSRIRLPTESTSHDLTNNRYDSTFRSLRSRLATLLATAIHSGS